MAEWVVTLLAAAREDELPTTLVSAGTQTRGTRDVESERCLGVLVPVGLAPRLLGVGRDCMSPAPNYSSSRPARPTPPRSGLACVDTTLTMLMLMLI